MKKYYLLLLFVTSFVSGQIVNIPDANFKAKLLSASTANNIAQISGVGYVNIDTNLDGEIQFSEASLITALNLISTSGATDKIEDFTGINNFINLQSFSSQYNSATISIDGLTSLNSINFTNNNTTVTSNSVFSNLPSLINFYYKKTSVNSIELINCPNVVKIQAQENSNLTSFSVGLIPNLKEFKAWGCNILTINIPNSPLLEELDLSTNYTLSSVSIGNSPLLKILDLSSNSITDVSGFVNNLNNIEQLRLAGNNISALILPVFMPNLISISIDGTSNNNLNFENSPNLQGVIINPGNMSVLNLSYNPLLYSLTIIDNPITSLDLSNNNLIYSLGILGCPLATLNLSNLSNLTNFSCQGLLITELDLSNNPLVSYIRFHDNINLIHVNLKSGINNTINYNISQFYNVPNLEYICIDEGDVINYSILQNPPVIPTSSYCSFTLGGDYNTITGSMIFDENNNGCDAIDLSQPNIKININDGANQGATFTNTSGNFSFFTQTGSFNLTPAIENPIWFNFSPTTATVPFANNENNVVSQNFCITPNGIHSDLEVVIVPIIPARPGFDAVYKIVYKNKGNQTDTGYVNFTYNDAVLDFVSASVVPNNNGGGFMNWIIPNIAPFQSGNILVTLNVNSPQETPSVNIDDVLVFNAFIDVSTDDIWADNNFDFNQTVVGSYDPNDITCLQGNALPTTEMGEFLHYNIRFENTGTYEAENIVVKNEIDLTQYNIQSLQVMESSHPMEVKVTGNIAEFIFQGIDLDTGGHGNILLKLKSNTTLSNDLVINSADIFFDYNFPIITNDEQTVFANLSKNDFVKDVSIQVYPNPTNDVINVKADNTINSIQLYDAQGRLLLTKMVNENSQVLNLSSYSSGIYFINIATSAGKQTQKIIKN